MLRFLILLVFFVALALATDWLVSEPGSINFAWLGYEGSLDIRLLVGAAALVLLLYTAVLFILRRIWTAPSSIKQGWGDRRRRRGYRALTQGMVAIAAGDPDEASKWSRRADDLLNNPPLTLLLAAQSAQLNGDEQAAKRYFEVMLDEPETRFLGLRGLVQIALRRGDEEGALDLVKEAYNLRPETPWVLDALFDLAERRGRLEEAVRALDEAKRRKALPRGTVDRRRAVLLYEEAKQAIEAKQSRLAIEKGKQALKLAPDFAPIVVLVSDSLVAADRGRDAERVLRQAWAKAPHSDVYQAWKRSRPKGESAEEAKKALLRLISAAPSHVESRLALAELAVDNGDWAEARNELQAAEDQAADARVAELLARLEQAEHGDAAAARSWLETAAGRPAAPAWVCEACGHETKTWTPRCQACGSFDSLNWKTGKPLPASGLALSPAAGEETTVSSAFSPVIATEAAAPPAPEPEAPAETPPAPPAAAPASAPDAAAPPAASAADSADASAEAKMTPEERARRGA
ncbi:MAG: heme biosynthesis HemY N-terminal domain-containing protein [Pseudomonadota bacterium]